MAAAGQPHADAAGDANLPAVHPAPNRTGESRCAGDARQSLDPDPAVDARGHHENPWQVVRLQHRHARDPRACHLPSGLSLALAVLQAHGVAGFAFDRKSAGAGADFLILTAGAGALILGSGLLAASRRRRDGLASWFETGEDALRSEERR